MPALDLASALRVDAPFPGLRPFEENEAHLFFGRETHVEELLDRLSRHRFLAVVGSSGCGKSSLIKAGVLPDLYRGYLLGATSRWRIAVMRPGRAPLAALERALARPEALGPDESGERGRALRKTSHGLLDAAAAANLPDTTALLLVVDQFEELFRVEVDRRSREPEDSLFVSLLLEAAQAFRAPVFVVLTMRSDFLGDCARFPGLPEALNRSQYLVPRLTRDQRQHAIERPLDLAEVEIEPGLVQLALNEAGDQPDDLPVMQHVLMRCYDRWRKEATGGPIGVRHYDAVGRSAGALEAHAEELMSRVSAGPAVVERVFRCLTTSHEGRIVRRPALLSRILAVTGVASGEARTEVEGAIQLFASPGNNLLVAPATLAPDSVVDISHESLINRWRRLREWVEAEAKSAEWYHDLMRDVSRGAAPWQGADLARAESLREKSWSPAWAEQYGGRQAASFEAVDSFLAQSRAHVDAESRRRREEAEEEDKRRARELQTAVDLAAAQRRAGRWLAAAAGLFVLFLLAVVLFLVVRGQNEEARREQAEDVAASKYRENALLLKLKEMSDSRDTLAKKTDELLAERSNATSTERLRIDQELATVQTRVDALVKQGRQVEQRLAQAQKEAVQAADGSQTTLLSQIGALQRDLKSAQNDAGSWRSRAAQLEAELKLRGQPPTFVVMPQYSYKAVAGGPFGAGDVNLLLGDIPKYDSDAQVYLVSGRDTLGRDGFKDNAPLFRSFKERVASRTACPGASKDGLIHCFLAKRDAIRTSTQRLGSFPYRGMSYDVAGVAWNLNATGTDLLTLAFYPSPPQDSKAR